MDMVFSTFPSRESATEASRTLVLERLAACANIAEVKSIYSWKGKLEEDGEFLCVLKTTSNNRAALEQRLAVLHPYEVPEIAHIEASVSGPYAQWLSDSTLGVESKQRHDPA